MFALFKKKKIALTNKSQFEKTLTSMTQILTDNSFDGQADAVRNILSSLLQDRKEEFIKRLNSVDMWGGAGAVWEVSGFRTSDDKIKFWQLLIELTDEMKKAGIINKRAFSTADLFRKEIALV